MPKTIDEAKKLPIPFDVVRGQRKIFYVGVMNWVRRKYGEDTIGLRDYRNYREPSDRWHRLIYQLLDSSITLVALGVERNPTPGQQVKIVLCELTRDDHWAKFVSSYKPLVVVRPRNAF